MYDDYPTVYETVLEEYLIYIFILGIVLFLLLIITHIALAKVFKKANRSGISAWIPFYNIMVLLEITNSPKWYLWMLLIPVINIIWCLFLMTSLSKQFRKSRTFALGLTFLPFIFYPILAFGSSEYIGINLMAMNGKSIVVDVPKIVEDEENNKTIHEEKDTSLQNINISIGGGVYQKDYTSNLLQVDEKQTISDTIPNTISSPLPTSNPQFIKPNDITLEEKKTMEDTIQNFDNSLPSIIDQKNEMKEETSQIINIEISSATNHNTLETSEFITCPRCMSKVKKGSKVCFLCGNKLD